MNCGDLLKISHNFFNFVIAILKTNINEYIEGISSIIVGHPWDTIKTHMQVSYHFQSSTMTNTLITLLNQNKVKGLYKGFQPPIIGAFLFRSMQYGVFEASFTRFQHSPCPVLISAVISAICRSIVETPLDFLKIRGQVFQNIQFGVGGDSKSIKPIACEKYVGLHYLSNLKGSDFPPSTCIIVYISL